MSSHHSASRRRSSTPSTSPPSSNTWAYATLRTGLARTNSLGSDLSQPSSVASCLLLLMAGMASSTRSAARSKSSAASAWRIASAGEPLCCIPLTGAPMQSGYLIGLLRHQMRMRARRQRGGDSDTSGAYRPAARQRSCRRSRASNRALPSSWPVTASHSGPFKRSRMAVWSKKLRTRSG